MALDIRKSKCLRTGEKSQPPPTGTGELAEEVQEIILARLSVPDIMNLLPSLSKSWEARMFAKSSFRRILDQKHPNMIAIVKMERRFELKVAVFDFVYGQWHYRVLRHLLDTDEHRKLIGGYVNQACFAHHGGLLCFVFSNRKKACPVVVCNLLTNEWKAIPFQEDKEREPILIQIAVDGTTGHYEVTVVSKYFMGGEFYVAATVYDSATKLWSRKDDGVVHGWELYNSDPYVRFYNCGTKECSDRALLKTSLGLRSERRAATFVTARDGKERYFEVTHEHADDTYRISEYVADTSIVGGVRMIDSYDSPLQVSISFGFHEVKLMDTDKFLLLVVYQFRRRGLDRQQPMIKIRDQVRGEWQEIPAFPKDFKIDMMSGFPSKHFMCELRYNAIP